MLPGDAKVLLSTKTGSLMDGEMCLTRIKDRYRLTFPPNNSP